MKRELLVVLGVLFSFIACSNPLLINRNMTGNWQAYSLTQNSSDVNAFPIGGTTTSYFSLIDNGSNIQMTSFYINGSSYITWTYCSGIYSDNNFTGNVNGYYYNTSNQIVNVTLSFAVTVNSEKTMGNGTFTETLSCNGNSASASGTTTISKID